MNSDTGPRRSARLRDATLQPLNEGGGNAEESRRSAGVGAENSIMNEEDYLSVRDRVASESHDVACNHSNSSDEEPDSNDGKNSLDVSKSTTRKGELQAPFQLNVNKARIRKSPRLVNKSALKTNAATSRAKAAEKINGFFEDGSDENSEVSLSDEEFVGSENGDAVLPEVQKDPSFSFDSDDDSLDPASNPSSSEDMPIIPVRRRAPASKKKKGKPPAFKRAQFLEGEEHEGELEDWEVELENILMTDNEVSLETLPVEKPAVEQRDPPPELLMPLLSFQKEFLAWALKQEDGPAKGGILADEMGMGKTIQAISLIVTKLHLENPSRSTEIVRAEKETAAMAVSAAPPVKIVITPFWSRTRKDVAIEPTNPLQEGKSESLGILKREKRVKKTEDGCDISEGSALQASRKELSGKSSELDDLPRVKATLVICPVSAIFQWQKEIEKFTSPGTLKVLVYHGPKRAINLKQLSLYDVVLTTYSIVESEYRTNVMPEKVPCQFCQRKYFPDKLEQHLNYYCGPWAVKTAAQAKQEKKGKTMMPAFPESSKNGVEIEEEAENEGEDSEEDFGKKGDRKGGVKGLNVKGIVGNEGSKKGGPWNRRRGADNKRKRASEQVEYDLGEKVASKVAAKEGKNRSNSALHAVKWNRIILDEAHSIKDRRCNTAKSVFSLAAEFRWALSGTPLQNRVGELYSLVRFLEVHPYSFYFCKKCECKSLDHRFIGRKSCQECTHSSLSHFCWWNKFIANPMQVAGDDEWGRKALILLKHRVLPRLMLRRTKQEKAADLTLPPRTRLLRRQMFDSSEKDFYHALYAKSRLRFSHFVDEGTILNNYAHIFDLLIRLRQAVNHPYLVVFSETGQKDAALPAAVASDSAPPGEPDCELCHETAEDPVVASCKDVFCRSCLAQYLNTVPEAATSAQAGLQCPGACAGLLTVDLNQTNGSAPAGTAPVQTQRRKKSILARMDLSKFKSSTKIEALREELHHMSVEDPSAKALVFSQFTSMLDLISHRLHSTGTKCVRLDGSMSMEARNRMIQTFSDDPDCKVFLMSLKAGGVALNLTAASHVFLMDPWWNPAVEQQAQDRIHRLGQYKPIKVTRFIIANSIEERILKLQEKKQLMFEGTVGGSKEAMGKLTVEDLRFLFTN